MPAKKKKSNVIALPSAKKKSVNNKNNQESDIPQELVDLIENKINEYNESLFQDNEFSDMEQAMELVIEAHHSLASKGQKLVRIALDLDPNCSMAYEYLGIHEKNLHISNLFFHKALILESDKLGGDEFIEENAGHFWMLHETRAYMRILYSYGHKMLEFDQVELGCEILNSMIQLNPNDNQGVRFTLMPVFLEMGNLDAYEDLIKKFPDDGMSSTLYNNALYYFLKFGKTAKTKQKFQEAIKSNRYIKDLLLNPKNKNPKLPDNYRLGSKEEAAIYVDLAYETWYSHPKSIRYLLEF